MQFSIITHTNLRAGQAIRLDCMELAASINATNSDVALLALFILFGIIIGLHKD